MRGGFYGEGFWNQVFLYFDQFDVNVKVQDIIELFVKIKGSLLKVRLSYLRFSILDEFFM